MANINELIMAATERIWQNSIRNGTGKMTMEEIDAEIAAVRAERKARKRNYDNKCLYN